MPNVERPNLSNEAFVDPARTWRRHHRVRREQLAISSSGCATIRGPVRPLQRSVHLRPSVARPRENAAAGPWRADGVLGHATTIHVLTFAAEYGAWQHVRCMSDTAGLLLLCKPE